MKIGVVLQGPINDPKTLSENICQLLKFFHSDDIVVSTWDDQPNIDLPVKTLASNIGLVRRSCSHFNYINKNNRVFQNFGIIKGIEYLLGRGSYDYLIKIRTDAFFQDYSFLIDSIKKDDRIHSGNLFFRKTFPFHMGDHLVAGHASEVSLLFNSYFNCLKEIVQWDRFLEDCNDPRYQRAILPESSSVNKIFPCSPYTIPAETVVTLHYLWQKESEVTVKDHVRLMKKHFTIVPFQNFHGFLTHSNTLEMKITHENIDTLQEQVTYAPRFLCTECPDEILCKERKDHSKLYAIIDGITNHTDELFDLHDKPAYVYNSVHMPWNNFPEFSRRLEI